MSTAAVLASSVAAPATASDTFDPTEARRQRGLAIAALCKITKDRGGEWTVPSQRGSAQYRVDYDPATPRCTCPDFEERKLACKHVFAVEFVITREGLGVGFVSGDQALTLAVQTRAPKTTYKQDWPAYNKAQVTEKARVQALLFDLCRGVPEPPRKPGAGRKPIPLADAVFAAVFKVYSTVSARRFMGDLEDAHAKGYVSKVPHFTGINGTLEMPSVAPILRSLIAQSALPLKSIEVDFAVDSSGFATSRFVRWYDYKYGRTVEEHDWIKCHVMTGVKTNVVTAVEIGEAHSADCPEFAPLVKATAKSFRIREVSADKAYLSYENMEAVAAAGGMPYLAMKEGITATRGGMLAKMFHLYGLNREDYLSHYHKRSNVESTFSMIKAKFGDGLRSKTDAAMENEALCKILCHNLCCLIQSACELGVVAKFWEDAGAAEVKTAGATEAPEPSDLIDAYAWV